MQLSKKEQKRLYDMEYRRKHKKRIKEHKRQYDQSPAGRATQKRNREKFKEYHLEYVKSDEYRKWKKNYDIKYRFTREYGEFWECMVLVEEIHKIVVEKVPDKYERLKMRGYVERMMAKRALKRHLTHGWNFNYSHVLF